MIRLYQSKTSSSSWRVRIALALKSLPYESVWIDLAAGEHLAEPYAQIAATRQVPALETDGTILTQSVAIIEYLDEVCVAPPLMPSGSLARARVRAVVELINAGIQPMHNIAVRRRLAAQFSASDADGASWARYWIETRFAALNRLIAGCAGAFACGDEVTMADVFLYPQVMASRQFSVEPAAFPAISKVMDRLAQIPAFRGSHPPEG